VNFFPQNFRVIDGKTLTLTYHTTHTAYSGYKLFGGLFIGVSNLLKSSKLQITF